MKSQRMIYCLLGFVLVTGYTLGSSCEPPSNVLPTIVDAGGDAWWDAAPDGDPSSDGDSDTDTDIDTDTDMDTDTDSDTDTDADTDTDSDTDTDADTDTDTDTDADGDGDCSSGTIVFQSDFESGNGGFSAGTWNGSANTWAHGNASSGPNACHSGTGCWATNLSGNYQSCEDSYTGRGIDLSACSGTSDTVYLVFWHWYRFEEYDDGCDITYYDGYTIRLSGNGSSWFQPESSSFVSGAYNTSAIEAGDCSPSITIHTLPGYEDTNSSWEKVVVPIPASMLNADFELRFSAGTDSDGNEAGAYIDDVCIAAGDYNQCS